MTSNRRKDIANRKKNFNELMKLGSICDFGKSEIIISKLRLILTSFPFNNNLFNIYTRRVKKGSRSEIKNKIFKGNGNMYIHKVIRGPL